MFPFTHGIPSDEIQFSILFNITLAGIQVNNESEFVIREI